MRGAPTMPLEEGMKILHGLMLGGLIAGSAQAGEAIITTDYLACNPERVFIRSEGIREKGDEKALKAFTQGAVLSGTCVSLKSGASVFTEGKGKTSGVIKIRPKGSYKTFFTSELAVQ
jgi:hypothetical protein